MFFLPFLAKAASFIGSNLFPILATGFSAYSQLQAGRAREQDMQYQADLLKQQARMEALSAKEESLQIKKKVQSDISRSRAMFAARGIKLGQGTALAAEEFSMQQQSEDIDTLMFGSNQKTTMFTKEAQLTQNRGKSQRRMSKLNAGMSIGQGIMAADFGGSKIRNKS